MTEVSAWNRALGYLASRPRTILQIKKYLSLKGYEESEIDETVSRLTTAGFLNDSKFAEGFSRARAEIKLHGPHRLKRDLIGRGVSEEEAEMAINEVFSYIDKKDVIIKAIDKWIRTRGYPEDNKDISHLHNYLFRLGFDPSLIIENIPKLRGKNEE